MACVLILFTIAAFAFFGIWGGIGLVFVQLFIGAVIGAFATSELARSSYVITTIGASMRQNLPLPMALEMAAVGQDYKRADILRNIKKWLVEGYSLSESLRRGYPKCPGYIMSMVAAGERIGQIPQAIVRLGAGFGRKGEHQQKNQAYSLVLSADSAACYCYTGITADGVYHAQISRGTYGDERGTTQLPAATRSLIKIAEFFTK